MALLPYLTPYLVPVFVLASYWNGSQWAFAFVSWFFLSALLLEFFAGEKPRNRNPMSVRRFERIASRFLTWFWPPLNAAVLVTALIAVQDAGNNLFAIGVATGTVGGMFGIPVAHELLHRSSRFERGLAEFQLTLFTYAHFCIEHLEGHHVNVGTPRDSATARFGESIYHFLPRTICGGFASAWRLEMSRLRREGRRLSGWNNRMLRYLLNSLALHFLIGATFGAPGVLLFVLQAVVSVGVLEIINYVEHYGLTRREVAPGRYERVLPQHSWNSDHRISNWLLFNVPRHSHHHIEPRLAYASIQHIEDAPQLPAGYFAMFILALFPPLWRRIMDPLVRCPK